MSLVQVVSETGVLADVSAPAVTFRDLKIATLHAADSTPRRRLRFSSNFLPLAGFTAGTRFEARSLGFEKGIELTYAPQGTQKIHVRSYGSRRQSNPLETQIDLQNQETINASIPAYTEACRWKIEHGRITISPMPNRVFTIGRSMKKRPMTERFEAFVGMTSGVDIRLMEEHGFTVRGVLEYRPNEARDTSDRTETGALNALANGRHIKVLANLDVYEADWNAIAKAMGSRDGVIACAHYSLQCDDFTNVKANSLKERSIAECTSTIDMVVPMLKGVDALRPATVVVEQVPGFLTSQAATILCLQLRRMGYQVASTVLDGADFGGLTGRKRAYIVASIWQGFTFPQPTGRNATPIHDILGSEIDQLRDIAHTSTMGKAIESGRARILRPGQTVCPTITKSQIRQAKDSVVIDDGKGGLRFIDGPCSKRLMGLDAVNTSLVTSDIEAEIVGQSVEGPMHAALMRAVHQHIAINTGEPVVGINASLF